MASINNNVNINNINNIVILKFNIQRMIQSMDTTLADTHGKITENYKLLKTDRFYLKIIDDSSKNDRF